jgi:hypothetical protein
MKPSALPFTLWIPTLFFSALIFSHYHGIGFWWSLGGVSLISCAAYGNYRYLTWLYKVLDEKKSWKFSHFLLFATMIGILAVLLKDWSP